MWSATYHSLIKLLSVLPVSRTDEDSHSAVLHTSFADGSKLFEGLRES